MPMQPLTRPSTPRATASTAVGTTAHTAESIVESVTGTVSILALVLALGVSSLWPGAGIAQPTSDAPSDAETAPEAPWLAPLSDGTTLRLPSGELLDPTVPSPAEYLGYPLGSRFTHHGELLGYLEALDRASPRVTLWSYGSSYEGRPLTLAALSTPANLARLEELRQANLGLADGEGRPTAGQPVFVWLGYGVHGNESSSAEAALATAYLLAADREAGDVLERVVVLIDPLSNPDGRERYVHGYEQRRGLEPDPSPQSREHREPWPGGRQNHYLFDLNRDWAWASQQETRHRLAEYRRWEPQVHVDLHEMSSRSSYFFPPAAEPVHPAFGRRTLDWLEIFGRGNAAAFDSHGWVYYKAENFDLFYPGYGDSYPALRGAVGMTYEMAGGGRAGLVTRLPDGSLLSLADRVVRHTVSSLATVATAADHAARLLADFADARRVSTEATVSFLWPADQPEAEALARLLDLHGIQIFRLSRTVELPAKTIGEDGQTSRRTFPAGTFVVSTRQPLARLAQVLLDDASTMGEDFLERQRQRVEQGLRPQFYDITAWSLPLAFNLRAYRMDGEPPALQVHLAASAGAAIEGQGRTGYLVEPRGLASYRFAAGLLRQGVRFRLVLSSAKIHGGTVPAGSLFIPRRSNPDDLEERLGELATTTGVPVQRIDTAWTQEGPDLGSDHVAPIRSPEVALVLGPGVSPTSGGSLWHLLDRTVEMPLTLLDSGDLETTDLGSFDTVILPEGEFDLDEETVESLDRWLRAGGTLVAVGSALEDLQEHGLSSLETWQPEESPGDENRGGTGETLEDRPLYTPGAILATTMPGGHPLTAGLPGPPPVLVRGAAVLQPTGAPQQDLLTALPESPRVAGFAWPEAEDRLAGSLFVAVEPRGRGRLVAFAQDPAFRMFWRGTMPLFLNAVLYGPSVAGDGAY